MPRDVDESFRHCSSGNGPPGPDSCKGATSQRLFTDFLSPPSKSMAEQEQGFQKPHGMAVAEKSILVTHIDVKKSCEGGHCVVMVQVLYIIQNKV